MEPPRKTEIRPDQPRLDKEHPCGPLRAASYTRVSSASQAEREISIPAQQREIRAFALKEGHILVAEFTDPGHSGMTMDRPGLQQMLQAARQGEFDLVIIHKSDRLSREELDALLIKADLKTSGVRVRSVTEPFFGGDHPMDEMMENIARGFNKLYISNLRTEIRKGRKGMALDKGRQSGHPPYGYRFIKPGVKGSGWEIDPETSVWIIRMFHELLAGKTYSDLARDMNALSIPPPSVHRGWKSSEMRFWVSSRIREILGNAAYVGKIKYQDELLPGSHPPLIDDVTFARVQAVMKTRTRNSANVSRGYFAGGVLRCPHCGLPLIVLIKGISSKCPYPSSQKHYITYSCRMSVDFKARRFGVDYPKSKCPGYRISQLQLLALLYAYLDALPGPGEIVPPAKRKNWRLRPDATDPSEPSEPVRRRPPTSSILKNALEAFPAPLAPVRNESAERAVIEKEISSIPGLRKAYQAQQAAGNMTQEELSEVLSTLGRRTESLQVALASLKQVKSVVRLTTRQAKSIRDVLEDPAISVLQKRDVLKMAFELIVPSVDKNSLDIVLRS